MDHSSIAGSRDELPLAIQYINFRFVSCLEHFTAISLRIAPANCIGEWLGARGWFLRRGGVALDKFTIFNFNIALYEEINF